MSEIVHIAACYVRPDGGSENACNGKRDGGENVNRATCLQCIALKKQAQGDGVRDLSKGTR